MEHRLLHAWIFQHAEKVLQADQYFAASFTCTPRAGCEVPACLLQAFYVACMPHPGTVCESYVRIRYGQHTCTAKLRACEQCGKCEGVACKMWGDVGIYKSKFFLISGNNLLVLGNQSDFQILQKSLWIYWCWKSLTDIGNYFPISVIISSSHEILDKCPSDAPGPVYWHGLILIPAWIINHMPG